MAGLLIWSDGEMHGTSHFHHVITLSAARMADNRSMHTSARFRIAVAMLAIVSAPAQAQAQAPQGLPAQQAQTPPTPPPQTLSDAYQLFYNARYEEAAALAMSLREGGIQDLENDEVRTSALIFQ